MLSETGKEVEIGVSDEERRKRRAVLDKATAKSLEKKWQEQDREEIENQEKAIAPPVITESRCDTCTSPYRAYIEQNLIKGYAYKAIADSIPPDSEGKKPSRKSLGNHFKEHMPINRQIVRAELEEAAQLLNQNYETGVKGALTTRGMLNTLARKAWEDAMSGLTTVEPKDLIQLVKLQNEMNTDDSQIKNEEAEGAIRIFMMAIKNICTPEQREEIIVEVKRLREMDKIEYEVEANLSSPKPQRAITEAEVVDEGTHTTSDN